jgi:titin
MRWKALALAVLLAAAPAWARDGERILYSGSSVASSSKSPAKPRTDLSAPSPLKATTDAQQVQLSWTNIANETGFLIERRRNGGGSFAEIAKTVADATSYTDTLLDSSQYEYRVRAYRASATMAYSPYTNLAYSTTECE